MRVLLIAGAVSAGVSVAAGAFGAHALGARLDARALDLWETAARYQMYHAIGLIVVAWQLTRAQDSAKGALRLAGWSFAVGTVLFSGSLYAMALTGVTALGAITPVGGVGFLAGWVALTIAAARSRSAS